VTSFSFYRPAFGLGEYEDYYEITGPHFATQKEAYAWFNPAQNPLTHRTWRGSPCNLRIDYFTLQEPLLGAPDDPQPTTVWAADKLPRFRKAPEEAV
jgi:hypothetical protein